MFLGEMTEDKVYYQNKKTIFLVCKVVVKNNLYWTALIASQEVGILAQ